MAKKINKLSNLTITSVDLCKQGANPEAYIKFFKSIDNSEVEDLEKANCNFKEEERMQEGFILEKMEEKDQETLKSLMEKYNVVGKEDEEKETAPETANEEKNKAEEELAETNKSVQKTMDELQEVKKELEIVKLAKSFVKYEDLGLVAEDVAKKYMTLNAADEDVAKEYLEVLDQKLDMQNESGVFKSYGKSGVSSTGWAGIEAQASEIRKSHPELTREQAIAKATEDNPELVAEYENNL